MKIFLRIATTAIATLIGAAVIPGIVIQSTGTAILFAIVLGILNGTLGNLLKVVGCLLNILTLGLFDWVINAIIIILAGKLLSGFEVSGFLPAILLALIIAFVSSVVFNTTQDKKAN